MEDPAITPIAEQSKFISFAHIMDEKIEVILIDIGNTRTKCVEVFAGALQEVKTYPDLASCLANYDARIPLMISSVVSFREDLLHEKSYVILDHTLDLPIVIDYKTPETLGPDRIAAAVGAWTRYPNENCLVIDIGTCMTIDLIDNTGVYRGGVISPGLKMRMKAMNTFSGKLPDISDEWGSLDLKNAGQSTKECLLSGAFFGMLNELNATIERFHDDFTSINVILTGGDAHFFESRLKARIFAGSKIVQEGLYCIWKNVVQRD